MEASRNKVCAVGGSGGQMRSTYKPDGAQTGRRHRRVARG